MDLENTIHLMHKHGFRMTPQRKLVMRALMERSGHNTLEEVAAFVQREAPGTSLSTLYRALDFLCEVHFAVAADIGGGKIVYEMAALVPHHHLVCRTCGAMERVDHSEVDEFFGSIRNTHGYQIDMQHLTLFGLCPACQTTTRPVRVDLTVEEDV